MRRSVYRAFALLGVGLVWGTASADCSVGSCVDVYVDQLYVNSGSQDAWLQTSGTESLLNCTVNAGTYLMIPAGSKDLYALLLAAQLADRKVNVRINEGSSPCSVAYVTMSR